MKRTVAILLSALLLLSGCGHFSSPQQEEKGYLIYYLAIGADARGQDAIRGSYEQLDLPEDASLQETASAVVKRLLQGSAQEENLVSPVPGKPELLSLDIQDRRAYVNLSGGFNHLSGVDLTLADYCLVLSLCELEGIQSVSVAVQGRAVIQQPKQILYQRDVLLSTMDDRRQAVEVVLYFMDDSGALIGERRMLEIYEGQTVAEILVAQLLQGPENRDLQAVIPKEFSVSSIRVENNVCYVNISGESLAELPEDPGLQQMILWSLADSLYSLESVSELRLLADGQEIEMFGVIPVDTVSMRPQG